MAVVHYRAANCHCDTITFHDVPVSCSFILFMPLSSLGDSETDVLPPLSAFNECCLATLDVAWCTQDAPVFSSFSACTVRLAHQVVEGGRQGSRQSTVTNRTVQTLPLLLLPSYYQATVEKCMLLYHRFWCTLSQHCNNQRWSNRRQKFVHHLYALVISSFCAYLSALTTLSHLIRSYLIVGIWTVAASIVYPPFFHHLQCPCVSVTTPLRLLWHLGSKTRQNR